MRGRSSSARFRVFICFSGWTECGKWHIIRELEKTNKRADDGEKYHEDQNKNAGAGAGIELSFGAVRLPAGADGPKGRDGAGGRASDERSRLRDDALLPHIIHDEVAAVDQVLGVGVGVVVGGVLGDGSDGGTLPQGQLADVLVEILVGRRLNAL